MVLAGLTLSPAIFAEDAPTKDNGTNATQPTSGSADSNRAAQNAGKGGEQTNTGADATETRTAPSANSGNSNRATQEKEQAQVDEAKEKRMENKEEDKERAGRAETPANETNRTSPDANNQGQDRNAPANTGAITGSGTDQNLKWTPSFGQFS